MSKKQETIRSEIYNFLKTRGFNPVSLGSDGKAVPVPDEAEVFQFDVTSGNKEYGKVYITIDGLHQVIVYFNDEIANSPKSSVSDGISWQELLRALKRFATQRQLSFKLSNQDNLENDMAKREHIKKQEQVNESYYAMGKKASYSDAVPTVTLRIQHSRALEENEQRFRYVERIFVENQLGERFLVPTAKPGLARVYARHIAEGGKANDERWNHITSLCEEYSKMAGFVRAVRGKQFNESATKLVEAGLNHYFSMRESLSKLSGHRGYNAYFESWTPTLMETEGDDSTNLNELFVQETLDPRIESVMPILSKLKVDLSEMQEVKELEEWADSVEEGRLEEVELAEKAPKGWEGTVKAMKKHKDDIDNPWALAHWMKNKGYKSHKEEGVAEDIGPEQISVGQLGPTEKVKPGSGARGKLVGGANESVELSEMDKSQPSSDRGGESSGDPHAKGGKATPVKAKDVTKHGAKELNKIMDKEHKKDVKEGQQELQSILRLLGK